MDDLYIKYPTRNIRKSLNHVVEVLYSYRNIAINNVKRNLKNSKEIDLTNNFFSAAVVNELDDIIDDQQKVHILTIKARSQNSLKFKNVQFYLAHSKIMGSAGGHANRQTGDVFISTTSTTLSYADLFALIFHEVVHILQITEVEEEYASNVVNLKPEKHTTRKTYIQNFGKYISDTAEFETTISQIQTYLREAFLQIKKTISGTDWAQQRFEYINALTKFVNVSRHDLQTEYFNHITSSDVRNTPYFNGSLIPSIFTSQQRRVVYALACLDEQNRWDQFITIIKALIQRLIHIK